MEKNINFSATQQLPWLADAQRSLILGSQVLPQVDPKADVKIRAGQINRNLIDKNQTKTKNQKEKATKSSYAALESKIIDVASQINYPLLPDMPQRDQKQKRNQTRQNLNTMPVQEHSNENNLLFTGQGSRKFRVVVLPPCGQTGNGPKQLQSKAMWTKIQQDLAEKSVQIPKKEINIVISHQRSQTTLSNFKGELDRFEIQDQNQVQSDFKQNKFLLRTDKRLVYSKPPGFLVSVGGSKTFGSKFTLKSNQILNQEIQKDQQAQQVAIFTGISIDQQLNSQKNQKQRIDHLSDIKGNQIDNKLNTFTISQSQQHQDDLIRIINNQLEKKQNELETNVSQAELNSKTKYCLRGLVQSQSQSKLQKIVKQNLNCTQSYIQQSDGDQNSQVDQNTQIQIKISSNQQKEHKYPEIFDRAERTLAATFAQVGNLSYFTPSQRIGCFMEFNQRLKRKHLLDLIAYIRLQKSQNKLDEEDDLKTDQEYQEQSLFHGNMLFEQAESRKISAYQVEYTLEIVSEKSKAIQSSVQAYNPCSSQTKINLGVSKVMSKLLIQQLDSSIKRYLHYIQSPNLIKQNEITQYKAEWMTGALRQVPDQLLQSYQQILKSVFTEIFNDYQTAMKQAILEYILLSPNERKRLNIVTLPKTVPTAAEAQAQFGGFSIIKFHGTHFRKLEAERQLKLNLINNNIVVSSLLSWFQEFRYLRLVDFRSINEVIRIFNQIFKHGRSQTIDTDNLFSFFEAYLQKSISVYKNLWYRGAVLITKKFKFLRPLKQKQQNQVWTFGGPTAEYTDYSYSQSTQSSNSDGLLIKYYASTNLVHQTANKIDFKNQNPFQLDFLPQNKEILCQNIDISDLQDIRSCPAYLRFVKSIGGNPNFAVSGYDSLDKQYKRELKYSAGNLIQRQLKEIVDQSIKLFVNFFKSIPTYRALQSNQEIARMREMKSVVTKIKKPGKLATAQTQNHFSFQFGKEQKQPTKQQETTIKQERDQELKLPDFLNLQDFVNPIISIQLLLASDRRENSDEKSEYQTQLHFNKQPQDILKEFERFYDQMLSSLSDISRPEFCKIKVLSQKMYEKKLAEEIDKLENSTKISLNSKSFQQNVQKTFKSFISQAIKDGLYQDDLTQLINPQILDFESIMYSSLVRDKNAYQNFFGRIKLEESSVEKQTKRIYDYNQEIERLQKNANTKVEVHRYYTHISGSEDAYLRMRQELIKNITLHLNEINQVRQIYTQFQDLIDGTLRARIQKFVQDAVQAENRIEEYKQFIEEIHYYRVLVLQLPERAAFPLFEVGLLQVKRELKQRVENLLFILLSAFEKNLLDQSNEIVIIFQKFASMLQQNLITPQDVVDMEASKNIIISEMAKLQSKIVIQKRCFLFLIGQNDQQSIFCEPLEENGQLVQGHCYKMVQQTLIWPAKIAQIIQSAEDRHQEQRTAIENQVSARRKTFDREISELAILLKKQIVYSDLKNYSRAYVQVKEMKVLIDTCKLAAEQLEKDEKQLFGNTQQSKLLQTICETFQPNYLLWKTAKQLMSKINKWQGSPMDEIKVTEVELSLLSCAKNLEKISQIKQNLPDSENILKVLAQIQREYEKILGLFGIIRVLSSDLLQQFHWDKIKLLVGSDSINLKKMNLTGVIALDLQSLTKELNEILKQAEQYSQIEIKFKEIQNDWQKRRLETVNIDETTNLIFDETQLIEYDALLTDHTKQLKQMIDIGNTGPLTRHLRDWYNKLANLHMFIQVVGSLQTKYVEGFKILSKIRQDLNATGVEGFDIEKFNDLDQLWQQTLARVQSDRYFINMTLKQDLLQKLQAIVY